MAKFIFVTGGVVSGLGKGITAASLGRLLKCRGLKVASQKLDPYVNVDPGTMSPLQHGEVFVTDDGTETDLDLGHYERFIDENLNKYSNLTTGKVYWNVLNKERQGAYLGQTVQIIPHITNEIKSYIYNLASSTEADVVITEIGGTTGDIESQPFLEAIRQVGLEQGRDNCCFIHVVLPVCRPVLGAAVALSFADCWNLVEQPLTYLTERADIQPLSVMFNQLANENTGFEFAGAALYILPALFVYLFFQEDILSGIQLTELK